MQAVLGAGPKMMSLTDGLPSRKKPPPTLPKTQLGPKVSWSPSSSSSSTSARKSTQPHSSALPSMPELGQDRLFHALFQSSDTALVGCTEAAQTSDPTQIPSSKILQFLRVNRGRRHSPSVSQSNSGVCEICKVLAVWKCEQCGNKTFCDDCYDVWHDSSVRSDHTRNAITTDSSPSTADDSRTKTESVVVFSGKKKVSNPSLKLTDESSQSGFNSMPFLPLLTSGDFSQSASPGNSPSTSKITTPHLYTFTSSTGPNANTSSGYDYIDFPDDYVNGRQFVTRGHVDSDDSDCDSLGYEKMDNDADGYLMPVKVGPGPHKNILPHVPSPKHNSTGLPSDVSQLLQQWSDISSQERYSRANNLIKKLENEVSEMHVESSKHSPKNLPVDVVQENKEVLEHGLTVLRQALKSIYGIPSQVKAGGKGSSPTDDPSYRTEILTHSASSPNSSPLRASTSVSELAKKFGASLAMPNKHRPLQRSGPGRLPQSVPTSPTYTELLPDVISPTHAPLSASASTPICFTGTGSAPDTTNLPKQQHKISQDHVLSSPTQELTVGQSPLSTGTGTHNSSSSKRPLHGETQHPKLTGSKSNIVPSTNLFGSMAVDIPGFSSEEIQLAQSICHHGDTRTWLTGEWQELQVMVVALASSKLNITWPCLEVPVDLAKEALLQTRACQDRSAQLCVNSISHKLEEASHKLESISPTPETRQLIISQILATEGGNVERAIRQLEISLASHELEKSYSMMGGVKASDISKYQFGAPNYCDDSLSVDLVESKIRDRTLTRRKRLALLTNHCGVPSLEVAERVVQLIDGPESDAALFDIIDAAHDCDGNISRAVSFLRQTCEICSARCPANKITGLLTCECKVCISCMKQYFELQVRDHSVREWTCAVCRQPDITAMGQDNEYFIFLEQKLKKILCGNTYALFQEKLKDWVLTQDPFFRWCSYDDCRCGIIFNGKPGQLRMFCPECCRPMCFRCKRPWDCDHDGRTCEDYKLLKDMDQGSRLGTELAENGIECPNCRFPYWVARGGCMHLTCSQCKYEFCSGCLKPFKRQDCRHSSVCAGLGLHCHHPRDCLAHLRDWSVDKLHMLLQLHNVDYSIKSLGGGRMSKCQALIQPEGATSLNDTKCNQPTTNSGFCHSHYVEHLVKVINAQNIDPITMMDMDEIKALGHREQVDLPPLGDGEHLNQYKIRLKESVKQRVPLSVKNKRSLTYT